MFARVANVSSLRSALDEYSSEELRFLSDQELSDSLVELERTSGAIEAERARRVAEATERAIHTRDGHLSTTSWLARLLRIPASVAGILIIRFGRETSPQ